MFMQDYFFKGALGSLSGHRHVGFFKSHNIDELVKSLEIVMPDLIRHPERIKITGFRLSPE